MYIDIKNVYQSYKNGKTEKTVLEDINLSIEKGEFICLLGPSGCGKSTLLNAMAGFTKVTSGEITIDNTKVEKCNPKYVTIFQNYGLLPWRNVEGNVVLGLENSSLTKEEKKAAVEKYLQMVGLKEYKKASIDSLSGGMKQRVSIARALAVEPEIIFMDEPFGALDAITRMKLQEDFKKIVYDNNRTIIFVTHDIEEAIYLADRIVVMSANPGKIASVIKVPFERTTRDRTSTEFMNLRQSILDIFRMNKKNVEDYVI